jgi:hypothetical protein
MYLRSCLLNNTQNRKMVVDFTKSKEGVAEYAKIDYTYEPHLQDTLSGCSGRIYSCSFEELRDLEWDELVKLKTSYLYSDYYYRNRQLMASAGPNPGFTFKNGKLSK